MSPRNAGTLLLTLALVPCLALAAENYKVDTVHSSVVFRVKHLGVTNFRGRFNDVSGTFALDERDPTASAFDLTVKTGSIDTADAKRDGHLKSPDFFNAVQFPEIRFKSKSVKKVGDIYEAAGDLTLHGVTRPVTAKVEVTGKGKNMQGGPIVGFEATLDIKRSEFGMTNMTQVVGDDVRIIAGIEGPKN